MREITLLVNDRAAEVLGDALMDAGALSVSIEDADADTPDEQPLYGEPGLEPTKLAWKNSYLKVLVNDDFDMQKWAEKLDGYSCADITNLCRDAAQAVFERNLEEIDPDEWANMNAEDAKVIIHDEDFEKAVSLRKSSVDAKSLKRYEEWRLSKGAE